MFIALILVLVFCVSPSLADEFVLNGDGDVADFSSGLIWQGSSVDMQSARDASSYCAGIDDGSNLSWRLPTQAELANLEANLNTSAPRIYWVTRNFSSDEGVYCFGDGAFFTVPVTLKSALVRCVTSNPLAPVVEAVNVWVESWQNGNIDGYLSSYRGDFKPRPDIEHHVWEQQRRQRLSAAKDLRIGLQTERVASLNKSNVEIVFLQDYRSNHYQDRVRKRLVLTQLQGRWLITREEQLSSLSQQTVSSATTTFR